MKHLLLSFVLASLFVISSPAQEKKVVETEFKVAGNCVQCKTRIEASAKINGVKLAKWDRRSKMLRLAYLPSVVTADSVAHRLASVGHDTEKYTAPDSVYNTLPACCLYRGTVGTH